MTVTHFKGFVGCGRKQGLGDLALSGSEDIINRLNWSLYSVRGGFIASILSVHEPLKTNNVFFWSVYSESPG